MMSSCQFIGLLIDRLIGVCFPSVSFVVLQQTHLQAAAAHSDLQEALRQLHRLRLQLQDSSSVVENTNNTVTETNRLVTYTHTEGLYPFTVSHISDAAVRYSHFLFPVSSANEVQQKLEEAEHRTERLMGRIKPLSTLGETLRRNLSDIRELINQARRQAASVHKHTHTEIHILKHTQRKGVQTRRRSCLIFEPSVTSLKQHLYGPF